MNNKKDAATTPIELANLPSKMRVHAAAKILGTTSKELLRAFNESGADIKSAQSSVTAQQVQAVSSRFVKSPAPAENSAPATAKSTTDGSSSGSTETATKSDSGSKKAPARRRRSSAKAAGSAETTEAAGSAETTKAAAAKTGTKKASAKKTTSPQESDSSSDTKRDRGETPASAVLIFTGEIGVENDSQRRRRGSQQQSPAFSPLFLSPDLATEKTVAKAAAASSEAAPEDTASTAAGSEASMAPETESSDDQTATGSRRGRRGRGRGRRSSDGNSDNADNLNEATEKDANSGTETSRNTPSRSSADRSAVADKAHAGDESDSADDTERDKQNENGDSSGGEDSNTSRRRRRRRRRTPGEDAPGSNEPSDSVDDHSSEDPPNTEVHERDSRRRPQRSSSNDEVKGISGSTRLEAKRQRRRDGRDASRRKQPVLSEADFLARRESIDRIMVVRESPNVDSAGTTAQIAVLEDNILVEHFVTTDSAQSMVGNVFLGRVQNVLPSMEAAFVDIGRGRNGVLYAGEVNWDAAGLGGKSRKIEQALKPGDMIVVQVTKDPVGQKGARLSTQISLAGRFLVFVPDGNSAGISRKLPDTERKRLKAILKELVPDGAGVIIRTAAEGVSEEEIAKDVDRLSGLWKDIDKRSSAAIKAGQGTTTALYEEPDLLVKVVRDLFNEDFNKLIIDGEKAWSTIERYLASVAPDLLERVIKFENTGVDAFSAYRIDEQISKALDRKVWLPSGGTLVIDRTEAMTVVDVNTGKFTGSGGNLEETVTRNNLEAAEETVRQLRLRDIGGMVVIDFIDMVLESNRDLVLRRLTEALGRDRTRHQVSEVTSLGLVQLTRKKLGTGLVEAFSTPCPQCGGRGLIIHSEPVETASELIRDIDQTVGGQKPRRGRKSTDSENGGRAADSGRAVGKSLTKSDKKSLPKQPHPAALAMSTPLQEVAGKLAATEQKKSEAGDSDRPPLTSSSDVSAELPQSARQISTDVAPAKRTRRRRASSAAGTASPSVAPESSTPSQNASVDEAMAATPDSVTTAAPSASAAAPSASAAVPTSTSAATVNVSAPDTTPKRPRGRRRVTKAAVELPAVRSQAESASEGTAQQAAKSLLSGNQGAESLVSNPAALAAESASVGPERRARPPRRRATRDKLSPGASTSHGSANVGEN